MYILQAGFGGTPTALRGFGVVSQFRVLRTGTLYEIRPDNMYQPLYASVKRQNSML